MTTITQDPPIEQTKYMTQASSPKNAREKPSVDVLLRRLFVLKRKHERRNSMILHLHRLYESDPVAHGMSPGADQMEIVVNRFFDTVNTFVDFKGIPPNIHFFPPDMTAEGRKYADDMEKYLYALYDYNAFDMLWPRVAFDMSLLGTGYMGLMPTTSLDGFIKYRRFTPVNFYPHCYAGTNDVKYYFYESRYSREQVVEQWGKDVLEGSGQSEAWRMAYPEHDVDSDEIIVLEYCDEDVLCFLVLDKLVQLIPHGFGFCPGEVFANIVKPDIVGGVSDVSTYECIQKYESELYSMIADIISYWADPMLLLKSDKLSAGEVNLGGITIVEMGGDGKFLEPNVKLEALQDQMKKTAQIFHDGTIPETLYGRVETKGALGSAPVLTGLQTKFMVRLNSLYRRTGRSLVDLNTMALKMAKQLYSKKRIQTIGWRKNRYFELDMYGSRIGEHLRHRVFWDMSVTDPDRHLVMELQKNGNKLQSKYRTIENLGMCAGDELELIRQEDIYEIRKKAAEAFETQRLQQEFMPQGIEGVNRNVVSQMKGRVGPAERPGPGRPRGVLPSAPRGEGRAPAARGFDPKRVIADLQAVKKLKGAVFLVAVDDTVDVAVTKKSDKGIIINAPTMQAYRGKIVFISIQPGEEQEGWYPIKGGGG